MVGAAGFEPATPRSQSGCATAAPRPDRRTKSLDQIFFSKLYVTIFCKNVKQNTTQNNT